ncbi:NUDIX hydrolase OS=Streptomyces cyaneofuscatus OX=66883 GN=G3I52_30260 PE=4 SV=1 [Streptomyces cyaneofuscatus]
MLTPEQLAAIRLQEEELLSWKLVARDDLPVHLLGRLEGRVRAALEVLESGAGTVELEDGKPVA